MPYSPFPITVDGVSLDGYAWNVDVKSRQVASVRTGDVAVAGVDGVAASLNDDLDQTVLTLSMWVYGTDPSGIIPADSSAIATCRASVDFLSYVFGRRHALMDVREVVDSAGTIRQAWCKRVDAFTPDIKAGGYGRFTVTLAVPSGLWQDVADATWTSTGTLVSGNFYEIIPFRGTTAPIADAITVVTGPAVNPQLVDFSNNAYLRLNGSLSAGQAWRVNGATWATRYGSGLTVASLDSDGSDAQAITRAGGSGTNRFLPLRPILSTGALRVQVALTGTGFTSATSISVRGRRRFFQ